MQLAMVLDGVIAKNHARLKHHLDLKKEKLLIDHGRTMKGREIVWIILDFFKTHKSMNTYFTYEKLLAF
eukprot:3577287-Alexandrium_andersonii.AAC.1